VRLHPECDKLPVKSKPEVCRAEYAHSIRLFHRIKRWVPEKAAGDDLATIMPTLQLGSVHDRCDLLKAGWVGLTIIERQPTGEDARISAIPMG